MEVGAKFLLHCLDVAALEAGVDERCIGKTKEEIENESEVYEEMARICASDDIPPQYDGEGDPRPAEWY